MGNEVAERLKPTLWRTCRALANRTRLRIMHAVLLKPGLSVSEIAHDFDINVAVVSKYLRELNARGLLQATRQAAEVRYWPEADSSMPQALALLDALSITFRTRKSPGDFIFRKATAFTHPRRILIIRQLVRQPLRFKEIRIRTGMSATALKRHLRKLMIRGFVRRGPRNAIYSLITSGSVLQTTLLKLADEQPTVRQ